MRYRHEHGYVSVAVLVLLLGAGAGLLNVTLNAKPAHALSSLAMAKQRAALVNARQSLISYATVYPYLYGPAGAGPAHFPCPDTDGSAQATASAASGLTQRRDGPNPPCVSTDRSHGHLPRHTALPGHRYLFHAESEQRLRYTVDGNVINNPVNRVVNLSTLKALRHSEVVSVSLPPEFNDTVPMKFGISANALISSTAASVAAWVVERSNRSAPVHCTQAAADDTTLDDSEALEAPDSSTGSSTTLVGRSATSQQMHIALSGCAEFYNAVPGCRSDALWLQLLDYPIVVDEACVAGALKANLIEGVPALRHWFVRNSWQPNVLLEHDESCVLSEAYTIACKLIYPYSSLQAIAKGADLIKLRWVVIP